MSFLWLKQYMPRGIYGRAALILLLPVVIIQLVVTVLFAQRHFEGVTHQMTDTVLRELALVLDVAEAAPSRAAVPRVVAAQLGVLEIEVTPVAAEDLPPRNMMRWYDYSGRVSANRFAQNMPAFKAVDFTASDGVRIYLMSDIGPLGVMRTGGVFRPAIHINSLFTRYFSVS